MSSLEKAALVIILSLVIIAHACEEGCFQCDQITKQCSVCAESYSPTVLGKCIKGTIKNCNLYLDTTFCLNCSSTFRQINGTCFKDYSGCIKNISQAICQICTPSLLLQNGKCLGILNCKRFNQSCNECQKGFILINNICFADQNNCIVFSAKNGVCLICKDNYALVGYKCIQTKQKSPDCQIYDEYSRCLVCRLGFILHQSSCFSPNEYSMVQALGDSNNIYLSLQNNSGPIQSKQAEYSNLYCKTIHSNECIECYSQFILVSGICKARNPLCREIFANGSCKSCYSGYIIKGQTCELLSDTSAKSTVDPFCSISQGQLCTQCVKDYYINPVGGCDKKPANCFVVNYTSGACMTCLFPYILVIGQCFYPIQNCLVYDINGLCYQCIQGYYLKDQTCFPNDVTCAKYDIIGRCIKCINTYYMVNDQCIYPSLGYDENCKIYTNSYCSHCKPGFYLSQYRCLPIDKSCKLFDDQRQLCLMCEKGPASSLGECK